MKREFAGMILASGLAAALAWTIGRLQADARVQFAGEAGDLLSVFFHDARAVLGKSLVTRADSYYHGGVSMDGGVHHDHDHDHDDHDDDDDHDQDHPRPALWKGRYGLRDPWAWLNGRLRLQEHRHLRGREVEEIIPWIWAACRASPNNIEAYAMGWYVLAKMRRQPEAGLVVLEEGIRNNPLDLELAYTLGQTLYTDFRKPEEAAAAFEALRRKAREKSQGDLKTLTENDGRMLANALVYLATMARARGDTAAIRDYFSEAAAVAPTYASTRAIQRLLETGDATAPARTE